MSSKRGFGLTAEEAETARAAARAAEMRAAVLEVVAMAATAGH